MISASKSCEPTTRRSVCAMGRDDTLSPVSAEDSLRRAEELLSRVEEARSRLETTDDPDAALAVLADLAELAKQVEAEIQRAKRDAEAEAGA